MNNSILMLKNLINSKLNPQQIVNNLLNNNQNPMLKNVLEMAQKNDIDGLKKFASNLYSEQGKDFETEFNNFIKNINNGINNLN